MHIDSIFQPSKQVCKGALIDCANNCIYGIANFAEAVETLNILNSLGVFYSVESGMVQYERCALVLHVP